MGLMCLIFWFRFMFSMVEKLKQPCFVESVGGVDVDVTSTTPTQFWSSSLSDVKNVHLESNNKLSNCWCFTTCGYKNTSCGLETS